ncbi:hypothetical protein J6590_040038 [Homalodisca vitripennis]|nr:hypothetical protein J6590_040038 [Homalodisca vitripennis]
MYSSLFDQEEPVYQILTQTVRQFTDCSLTFSPQCIRSTCIFLDMYRQNTEMQYQLVYGATPANLFHQKMNSEPTTFYTM